MNANARKQTPKNPDDMTLEELEPYMAAYFRKKRAGYTARPKLEKPCAGCGTMLGARERRVPCPKCSTRNTHTAVAAPVSKRKATTSKAVR